MIITVRDRLAPDGPARGTRSGGRLSGASRARRSAVHTRGRPWDSLEGVGAVTRLAAAERAALADTLERVGPDAPTLCAGWTTADLAAHLVVRDRRPDAAAGILVRPLAAYGDRVRDRLRDATPWPELLRRVRSGGPLSHWGAADEAANLAEMVVHHEDVLRGGGGEAEPRALPPELDDAVWRLLPRSAKLTLRRAGGLRVEVAAPDGRRAVVHAGDGSGRGVVVTGAPVDLLLVLFGRRSAARVEVTGDASDVARFDGLRISV